MSKVKKIKQKTDEQKGNDIGWAMSMLKNGYRVRRSVKQDIYMLAIIPALDDKQMLIVEYIDKQMNVPVLAFWNPTHEDSLATDYLLIGDSKPVLNDKQVESVIASVDKIPENKN